MSLLNPLVSGLPVTLLWLGATISVLLLVKGK
jgi:hypothetical protein